MIRKLKPQDREIFLEMAQEFYNTTAVSAPIPLSYHEATFNEAMRSDCYITGYIFQHEGAFAGYGITSKSFSPEAGGIVIWIEDVYIRSEFRSKGLGRLLFEEVEKNGDPNLKRIRLEIEKDNIKAISLYERLGFTEFPYGQMIKKLG